MQFHSFGYLFVFLPLALLCFYALQGTRWRNPVLIAFSFTFYGWAEPWIVSLLFLASVVDYRLGNKIHVSDEQRRRRFYLIVSLVFNLSLLFFFKYWDWVAELFHLTWNGRLLQHKSNLPPGISFYTFQTLSYTIDIYRRQFKPKGTFVDYLAFIAFFPHLVAGPIMRARDLLPNIIRQNLRIKPRHVEGALFMIAWGLVLKLVFADNFGHLVDRCRDHLDTPGAGLVLALAFTFQIYCDFSAYSTIARGSARLFGIRLWRNFLTPYFAANPSDFWRRWHISLSTWVRDYVYIPLGGNRHGRLRTLAILMFTMFIMGLWHGAGVFFVLWGLYHGVLLAIYRLVPIDKLCVRAFGRVAGKVLATALMFALVVFGWVLFWSKDGGQFVQVMQSIGALAHGADALTGALFYGLALFVLPVAVTDAIGFARRREFIDAQKAMPGPVRVALYLAMLYAVLFFGSRGSYDYIYFQF